MVNSAAAAPPLCVIALPRTLRFIARTGRHALNFALLPPFYEPGPPSLDFCAGRDNFRHRQDKAQSQAGLCPFGHAQKMNSAQPTRILADSARRSGRSAIFLVAGMPFVGHLSGCSLQDFSYLQDQKGATGGAGGAMPATDGSMVDATGGSAKADAAPDVEEAATPSDAGDAADGTGLISTDAGVNMLANASFEQGLMGWTFDPMSAEGKYAFTQFPVGTATVVDGQYELATWHGTDAFRIRVYQSLTGLENGRYTFKGWFNRGDGQNAVYVYSSGCGGPDQQTNIPLTNATQWIDVGIGGINVTNNQCEVGFVVDANPTNWLNADAFTFERDPQ